MVIVGQESKNISVKKIVQITTQRNRSKDNKKYLEDKTITGVPEKQDLVGKGNEDDKCLSHPGRW